MLNDSLCQQVSVNWLRLVLSKMLILALSYPLILAAIVVALASLPWVLKRSRLKKPVAALGIISLVGYLAVISPVAGWLGTRLLVGFLPADAGEKAGAIVVLGRGEQQNPVRAEVAGDLWQAKRAPLIFTSGRQDAPLIAQLIHQQFPKAVVEGEPCSATTDQNAEFTASLLRPLGIKKIILVTDPPHMWRSLLTFQSFGFEVTPHFSPLSKNTDPVTKRFIVFRETMGLISYGLMGRYAPKEVPSPSIIYSKLPHRFISNENTGLTTQSGCRHQTRARNTGPKRTCYGGGDLGRGGKFV